jgi:diacylglycerol kinase family enzyme
VEHLFIINPKAFSQKSQIDALISRIELFFKEGNGEKFSIHISRFPRDAIIVIRRYLKNITGETRVRVYAAGGDGVGFCCLNGIIGTPNTELALLPYGTGNDFVRAFGKEHYGEFRDLALQTGAPVTPTDVIKCNNNYALNYCMVGGEAIGLLKSLPLTRRFEKLRRLFPGLNPLLHIIGAFIGSFDTELCNQDYEISADGEVFRDRYTTINIANGPWYAAGNSANPDAIPTDGFLDLLIGQKTGPVLTMLITPFYLRGLWRVFPRRFTYRRVKRVSIRSSKPLIVNIDGELFFDTGVEVEIVPAAVNIAAVNGLEYHAAFTPETRNV